MTAGLRWLGVVLVFLVLLVPAVVGAVVVAFQQAVWCVSEE